MILHTIISMEDVMGSPSALNCVTKNIKGGFVELQGSEGNYTINRLFSTDPAMYLKKEYNPTSPYQGS